MVGWFGMWTAGYCTLDSSGVDDLIYAVYLVCRNLYAVARRNIIIETTNKNVTSHLNQ